MPRICMVAYTHYPTDSRIRREAESLVERGDEVDMICLGESGEENPELFHNVRLIKIIVKRYRGDSALRYIFSYLHFFFSAVFQLTLLHVRKPYHLIQVHTMPDFMVFTAIIPKLLGIKVLLDVHDLMPELYESKFNYPSTHPLIRLITWVERISISFADSAMAVHKPHLEALCTHGNPRQKFTILLNLPDPKIFDTKKYTVPEISDGKFELIYHGMLARRNGLETAIRAVASLQNELDGLRLTIIGDGDDVPHLKELIEEFHLKNIVDLSEGMVSMEKLIPRILRAEVGVVPIFYDDFTKYMLPVKLLEYVALEKPVICSRTETIEAYFDDSQVQFFSPGDEDDLAEKIWMLAQHPCKLEELNKNAFRFNQTYSWYSQKQIYHTLVDSLMQKKENA